MVVAAKNQQHFNAPENIQYDIMQWNRPKNPINICVDR